MHPARGLGLTFALALALALEGCAGATSAAFDISAAHPRLARRDKAQVRVRLPTASRDLDGDGILVRAPDRSLAVLGGAKWADTLPDLVAARLVQSFQNARGPRAFSEAASAAAPYDLETELRQFEFDAATSEARVAVYARIVLSSTGAIVAGRLFEARVAVGSDAPARVAAGLDTAIGEAMDGVVRFVAARL